MYSIPDSRTASKAKNIHIQNLTNLVELLEAEGIREKVILICGGPRISNLLAKELGYKRKILTQGPKRNPFAWSGKKMWIDKRLGVNTEITVTRDKSGSYGKVLVDDYPSTITLRFN